MHFSLSPSSIVHVDFLSPESIKFAEALKLFGDIEYEDRSFFPPSVVRGSISKRLLCVSNGLVKRFSWCSKRHISTEISTFASILVSFSK